MQLITVRLLGDLGELFTKELQLVASSVGDIIRGIEANFPNFMEYIKPGTFNVYQEGSGCVTDLGNRIMEHSDNPGGRPCLLDPDKVLYILPIVHGSGGFLRAVIGVALVAVGLLIPGAGFLVGIGASLILGGITDLFTPTVKSPKKYERQDSHLFNDSAVVEQATQPIPICYGTYLCQGIPVISSSITKVKP